MSEKRVGELSPSDQSALRTAVAKNLQGGVMEKEAKRLKEEGAALIREVLTRLNLDKVDMEGEGSISLLPPMPNPPSTNRINDYLVRKGLLTMDQVEAMWGEVTEYRDASYRYYAPRGKGAGENARANVVDATGQDEVA
jgi:hypothetical protein